MCDKKTPLDYSHSAGACRTSCRAYDDSGNGVSSLLRGSIQTIWREGSEKGSAGLDRRIGDDGLAR
jgi:hypothetical protein